MIFISMFNVLHRIVIRNMDTFHFENGGVTRMKHIKNFKMFPG